MEQLLWAVKAAPVADVNEWAVLVAMAEAADQDGCNTFLSVATITDRIRLAESTVRRRIKSLESRGLIKRGDQESARMIPPDRRPVVYDVQVPHSYFRTEKAGPDGTTDLSVNTWRQGRGRNPLTPEDRPDIAEAPGKHVRADKGTKRNTTSADVAESDPSALFGVDAITPDNARVKLAEISACNLCDDSGHVHGTIADCDHVQPKQRTRPKDVRDDAATNAAKLSALHATRHEDAVHDTLAYLADTVERNGSRRPTFDAVDYERMAELIKHERSRPEGADGAEVRIRQVIDWTQTDGHWQPIILTAEKLHEHYDAVRLRTVNAYKVRQSGGLPGRPGGRPFDRRKEILTAEMERLDRENDQRHGREQEEVQGIDVSPMDYLRQITSE